MPTARPSMLLEGAGAGRGGPVVNYYSSTSYHFAYVHAQQSGRKMATQLVLSAEGEGKRVCVCVGGGGWGGKDKTRFVCLILSIYIFLYRPFFFFFSLEAKEKLTWLSVLFPLCYVVV